MHYYCSQLCLAKPLAQGRHRKKALIYSLGVIFTLYARINNSKISAEEKKIASNSGPRGHEATALPFALRHFRGVADSSRALIHQAVYIRRVHV